MIFTKEQEAIFDFVQNSNGHGIIDAVAGAGKTTTIMECAKYVEDKRNVLFCAFNNSIANEIASKFRKRGMQEVTVKTIHALGLQILKDNNSTGHSITLENGKFRELLKSKEIQRLLEPSYLQLIKLNNLDPEALDDKQQQYAIKNLIFKTNNRLIDINEKFRATLTKDNLEDFVKLITHFGIFHTVEIRKDKFKNEISCYFECHRILLEAGNSLSQRKMIIDFTDMLYLPFRWGLSPNNKFEFLFIDECQDLSKSQFAVTVKYGKRQGRILAVGDPQQSIYGFTGADIESFDRVKTFTQATPLPLTTCFRCPQKVIEIAKSIRTDLVGNKQDRGVILTPRIRTSS